ncbi:late embryogenesis abundant protein Lea5 isoform X1 [Arachis duranensis]|uniref:Late embryogenesis abundant protein 3 n=2 Tax=Arachis TaxID=3817 RepID=A0A6M5CI22_ARAHY|nr:late embryogenesis abundant protein Lea5 isoform X1 [Arachis duranensis]XP_025611249.1 late embryogenesis abundant protein Lea5 isoform X1 [Arachis hypogaea]QJT73747.1 late embryogenesis abundant protein 3 [Arachis hypogaea]
MARSLSQASRLGALVAEASSSLIPLRRLLHGRRGYAAVSDASNSIVEGKGGGGVCRDWAPDPVSGYYRPINHTPQIDPVELRHMFLNRKLTSDHTPGPHS